MCCITTVFLLVISRIGIVFWWLAYPQFHNLAFKDWVPPSNLTFPAWLWTLAGGIFLPWTTLAYLFSNFDNSTTLNFTSLQLEFSNGC